MAVKAVLFDAYGTLLKSDLMAIPRRIVADHGLSASVEDVSRSTIPRVCCVSLASRPTARRTSSSSSR
jgi:hypothetical protein